MAIVPERVFDYNIFFLFPIPQYANIVCSNRVNVNLVLLQNGIYVILNNEVDNMEQIRIDIGNRISAARINRELKQTEVCAAIGISQSAYSRIERGEQEISTTLLPKLAELLGVTVTWIVEGKDTPNLTPHESYLVELYKQFLISTRDKR